MRALLQRVTGAEVRVEGELKGRCGRGYLVLLGVGPDDDEATADAEKSGEEACADARRNDEKDAT